MSAARVVFTEIGSTLTSVPFQLNWPGITLERLHHGYVHETRQYATAIRTFPVSLNNDPLFRRKAKDITSGDKGDNEQWHRNNWRGSDNDPTAPSKQNAWISARVNC